MDARLDGQIETGQDRPFAPGLHLLVDFWQCRGLRDAEGIERALRESAEACGATVLNVMLHDFGENGGITGVALLAESHISIHTWPETGYAAIDLFMCGRCDPRLALPVLEAWFLPSSSRVGEHRRGVLVGNYPGSGSILNNNRPISPLSGDVDEISLGNFERCEKSD